MNGSRMGKDYGAYAAKNLSENLYERMIGVWYSLEARGEVPRTAEEFANAVTHTVFDALSAGLSLLNDETGKHPDDPRLNEIDNHRQEREVNPAQ